MSIEHEEIKAEEIIEEITIFNALKFNPYKAKDLPFISIIALSPFFGLFILLFLFLFILIHCTHLICIINIILKKVIKAIYIVRVSYKILIISFLLILIIYLVWFLFNKFKSLFYRYNRFTIRYKIDKYRGITHLTTYDSYKNYIILSITYPAKLTSSFKFLYRRLSTYTYYLYIIKKRPIEALFFLFPELIWFILYIFFLRCYICKQFPITLIFVNLFLIATFMAKLYIFLMDYLYRLFNLYQLLLAVEDITFNLGDEFEYFLNAIATHGYEYLFKSLIKKIKMFLPFS